MSGSPIPSPIVMAFARSARRATKRSFRLSSTRRREPAEHTSPWLKNTPIMAHSTAPSRSASAKTMLGDLPPSSSPTFFRLPTAALAMSWPVRVLPVKVIMSMSWLSASSWPAAGPVPRIRLAVPAGSPTSSKILNSSTADNGVSSLGLKTTQLPAASAGASFQVAISSG